MITYRVNFYETKFMFNSMSDAITRDGWTVRDFRIVDSPMANEHGVLVMWQRSDSPELKEHL